MVTIPSPIADKLLGVVFDYLKRGGESLAKNIAAKKAIKKAIERASGRFTSEYKDEDLAKVLTIDTRFYDLPSIQKAIGNILEHPFDPAPQVRIEEEFANVLPESKKDLANDAVQRYLEILREQLIGVEELSDKLKLIYLKRTAAATERTADGVEELVAKQKVSQSEIDKAREKYLQYLIDTNTYIDPRGIMQTRRSVVLKLDEVYVTLAVEHEIIYQKPDAIFGDNWQDEVDEEEGEDLEESNIHYGLDDKLHPFETIDLARAVRENPRVVILGEPGSGKTTLTRFLALQYASQYSKGKLIIDKDNCEYGVSRLPILLRISNYADAFSKSRSLSLRTYLLENLEGGDDNRDALKEMILNELNSGQAVILLDGLDEIIDIGDRTEITRRIEDFVVTHSLNSFIVTSRIAGYWVSPLGGVFGNKTFKLRELEPQQIEKFLRKWCPAIEKSQMPDASINEIDKRAKLEVDGILQAVDENLGVRRLATNPLMLTILALIHRAGARLPSRRVELYELAVKTLLEDWELARGIPEIKIVKESEALRLLGPLAYWIHKNKPRGLATEREVKEQLAKILGMTRNLSPSSEEIELAVEDFLKRVREHTGILVERAPKQYGFMHLTIEEYFVARELVRRRSEALIRVYEHRHNPRWEEPILLAIAFMSNDYPEDAQELIINAIIADNEESHDIGFAQSPYENILHQDLLFAVQIVGVCAGLEATFYQLLLGRLLKIYFDVEGAGKYRNLRQRISTVLRKLRNSDAAHYTAPIALAALYDKNYLVRIRASEALGQLGVKSNEVKNGLLLVLKDENIDVRRHAASALGWLQNSDSAILDGLLNAVKDNNPQVRGVAVYSLGWLGMSNKNIIEGLFDAIKDENSYVRGSAASALGKLDIKTDHLIGPLLIALQDEDLDVRSRAVITLGRLGISSEPVLVGLIKALRDKAWVVRLRASEAISRLDIRTEIVVDNLIDDLRSSDEYLRRSAASALGQFRLTDHKIIASLVVALNSDEDSLVRAYSASALGWLGQIDEEVRSSLLAALDDNDGNVRQRAAAALGELGLVDEIILKKLLILLTRDRYGNVRERVATALGNLGVSSDVAVDGLLTVIFDQRMGNKVRAGAVRALRQLGVANRVVVDGLLLALKDKNRIVREQALKTLGQISINLGEGFQYAKEKNIKDVFIEALNDSESTVRDAAWLALWRWTSNIQ